MQQFDNFTLFCSYT